MAQARHLVSRGLYAGGDPSHFERIQRIWAFGSPDGEPLRDEMISDLRRGGTAVPLNHFMRVLYNDGSI
jgi:hypothetical protein